jgi:hypothetical protein
VTCLAAQRALRQAAEVVQSKIRQSGASVTATATATAAAPAPAFAAAPAAAPMPCPRKEGKGTTVAARRPSIISVSTPRQSSAPFQCSCRMDGYAIKGSSGIFGSKHISYKILSDITEFNPDNGESLRPVQCSVNRRYSDFVAFEGRLRGLLSRCILPVLPPKEVSRQTADDVVVQRRMRYLQAWLRFVSRHHGMARLQCFGRFVSDSPAADSWARLLTDGSGHGEGAADLGEGARAEPPTARRRPSSAQAAPGHGSGPGRHRYTAYNERERYSAKSTLLLINRCVSEPCRNLPVMNEPSEVTFPFLSFRLCLYQGLQAAVSPHDRDRAVQQEAGDLPVGVRGRGRHAGPQPRGAGRAGGLRQ